MGQCCVNSFVYIRNHLRNLAARLTQFIDDNLTPTATESNPAPEPEAKTISPFKSMTLLQKVKYIGSNITIEPVVAFYIMASLLVMVATTNLAIEKACRTNLKYGKTICDALTKRETENYEEEENSVQRLVATMIGWENVVQGVITPPLVLLWGSWSDRNRRHKPCLLIPIAGEALTALIMIIIDSIDSIPMEVVGVNEVLINSLTGGWFTFVMAAYSYISEITTPEERSVRVGIVSICLTLGTPIGSAINGFLLRKIGFLGVYPIAIVFYIIAFCFCYFGVKDVPWEDLVALPKRNIFVDFFDKANVIHVFEVIFKDAENRRRLRVILLVVVVVLAVGPLYGEMAVTYLFARKQFNWDELDFSFWSIYKLAIGLGGSSALIAIFTHIIKVDDTIIGVISAVLRAISGLFMAFAVDVWHTYTIPILEALHGTQFAVRLIAIKIVSSEELSKVNSLISMCEALMPLIFSPIYTEVYQATLSTLPGAFYLVGVAFTVPAVGIYLWMYRYNRKLERDKNSGEINQIDNSAFEGESLA